jgi:hypothetical protein
MSSPQQATPVAPVQAAFQRILPRIQLHAEIHFRQVKCPDQRADLIAEVVALAWQWFQRLAEKGKDASQFPSALATFATRAARCGRRVCGQEKAKDVMSPLAQQRHGFKVESLPASTAMSQENLYGTVRGQEGLDEFEERLQDNTQTPVPDQVAFRIDWPRFFRQLTWRDRNLARFLALGHSGKKAAEKFQLSPGRVTQLRQEWCREWKAFCGELALATT